MTQQSPVSFRDAGALSGWLAENHATSSSEFWVRIFKVGSGTPSVTWAECVVEAIRFGWIDGRKQALDAASFRQRLTPRTPRSHWSSRNREHALRLIDEGRMMPAGMAKVEAAMADGCWESAYVGSAGMAIPQDFLDALAARPAAEAFFATLDRRNLYAIYYRLDTATRPETRAKRMAEILAAVVLVGHRNLFAYWGRLLAAATTKSIRMLRSILPSGRAHDSWISLAPSRFTTVVPPRLTTVSLRPGSGRRGSAADMSFD